MEKTTTNGIAPPKRYIDGRVCTGARFSFCDNCKKAQQKNAQEIAETESPAEVTAAHIVHKQKHNRTKGTETEK